MAAMIESFYRSKILKVLLDLEVPSCSTKATSALFGIKTASQNIPYRT